MKVISNVNEIIQWRKSVDTDDVGFVPTMGSLHDGHFHLVRESIKESKLTVVSIFLNPTQFNNQNDLDNYPIDLELDINMLKKLGVDVLFTPSFDQIYPDEYKYKVVENDLSLILCGKDRPGHFDGVLTVVMKLLNIVTPARAYFGEKDYQQLQLVRQMTRAFFMDVKIVACQTVREASGLALSSRNKRLTLEEHEKAPLFYKALTTQTSAKKSEQELLSNGFDVDYVKDIDDRRYGAVRLGDVRLIDNVQI